MSTGTKSTKKRSLSDISKSESSNLAEQSTVPASKRQKKASLKTPTLRDIMVIRESGILRIQALICWVKHMKKKSRGGIDGYNVP